MDTSIRVVFVCASALAITCGIPAKPPAPPQGFAPAGFGGAEGEAASGDQCVVPKGDTKPFVVEWDAAKRNEVKQLSNDGLLLVVHSGCGLTFLDGCGVGGGYDDVDAGGDKISDSFDIGSATQLRSRLPIGYFELYGKFQKDDRWTLEYVYANSKKAKVTEVGRAGLPQRCAQATHYVSRIMLGAYRLRSAAAQGGAAGATVKEAGVTIESGNDAEIIRQGGDFQKCREQITPSDDGSCQAIVQIYLKEIDGDGPAGTVAETLPASVVQTTTQEEHEVGKAGEVWIHSGPANLLFTKSEITVAQYRKCVDAGSCTKPFTEGTCNWDMANRADHPMNCIDSNSAEAVCKWLGGRLPSEEEWYAEASNNGSRIWPWGPKPEVTCDYAVWGDGSNNGCGRNSTWPVCSKPKGNSVSGLCDMSGNVWEWTSTDYDQGHKVVRGGSWFYGLPGYQRAISRYRYGILGHYKDCGVRCARAPQ